MNLNEAAKIVNKAIRKETERLQKIATTEEQEPIIVEGYTSKNHYCQLMADPKGIARILLNYDFPTWKILGDDAPDEMWNELGKMFGLESVSSVDL